MTFADWRNLSPAEAARTLTDRVASRLPAAQQRAAIASLAPASTLAERFAAPRGGGPLGGVPYFAKDLFDAAGMPTLAGSTFLPEVRAAGARDGAFVAALNAAGAILAGKSHMHEFAYGITGENAHYGDVEHPRFPGRTTGGSSSGSAALVAAGVVPLALGSDTGGSVRVPAAFCGLFGFRQTPREPWIADAFPLSPSMDTAGWFTATAGDMRESLAALVGLRTSQRTPQGGYLEMPDLAPEVAEACRVAAARLTAPLDASTQKDLRAGFAPALDTYNTLVALEAWDVHRAWAERYRERYSQVVWQRLNRVHSLAPSQIDAAHQHRATLRLLWTSYFLTFDYLILPAAPFVAPTKEQCTLEARGRILALTSPASLGGLPVLTLPVSLPSGLTTGLQVIVNHPQSPVINWALEKWL